MTDKKIAREIYKFSEIGVTDKNIDRENRERE
jgi:hypothetical protein